MINPLYKAVLGVAMAAGLVIAGDARPAVAQSALEREMADVIGLNDLANPNSDFYRDKAVFTVTGARAQVIESAARGVGIRGGYAVEAARINDLLMQRYRSRLQASYNFQPLMLNGGYVVPPVITQIRQVSELSGPNYLYLTNGSYEIVREPRLTTIIPTWMDWLLLPIREVRPPENITLENGDEERLWSASVREGWDTGIREARLTFTTAMATINRDYTGMLLFRQLASQGILTIPTVDVRRIPWRVTEDGRRAFEGETVVEIKVGSQFRRRN